MSDIAEFLTAQYDRIEKRERGRYTISYPLKAPCPVCSDRPDGFESGRVGADETRLEPCGHEIPNAQFLDLYGKSDPDLFILADIESKRQIIREVMSWRHEVVDGDCWFTCGAATEERDGGECCNDNQRDECTCGLDERRERFLSLLAAPFSGEPGYDAERWAV